MTKATIILTLLLSLSWAAPAAPAPTAGYGYQNPPPLRPADPQAAVSNWIIKHTWNPGSYQALNFSDPVYVPFGWHFTWAIRHIYQYEHPEYGLMENDDIFYFDPEGFVAGRTETSLWRNQAMPVPDWGWGWEKWGPEGKQPLREEADRTRDNQGW